MRKIYSLLTLFLLCIGMGWAQSYSVNFENGTSTVRRVSAITLNGTSLSLDGDHSFFVDLTAKKFQVHQGEDLTCEFVKEGTLVWMHGYLYVDEDKNGFTGGIADDTFTPTGDLKSYSCKYDLSQGYERIHNSLNEPADPGSSLNPPVFKAPAVPGVYRMRWKVDWDNVDPGGALGEDGTPTGKNSLVANNGSVIDVTLEVLAGKPEPKPEPKPDDDYVNFSNGTQDFWYYVQFSRDPNRVLRAQGQGAKVVTATAKAKNAEQLWKFVGDNNQFQMISKSGVTAYVDGTGNNARLKGGKNDQPGGFKIVKLNASTFEIHVNNIKNAYKVVNQWSDLREGQDIGFWTSGDANCGLFFVNEADMIDESCAIEGKKTFNPESHLTLWYDKPAHDNSVGNVWMEYSLPIGNGQLGGSLFGGVLKDEIQFNEKTLWTGGPHDMGNRGLYKNFGSVFAKHLGGDFSDTDAATEYVRFLDIEKGVGGVDFSNQAAQPTDYSRRYIASNPDQVIAAHYTAKGAKKLNMSFEVKPARDIEASAVTYADGYATFHGKLTTVSYCANFKVVPVGEKAVMKASDKGIVVENADEILLVLAAATDYDASKPSFVSGTDQLAALVKTRVDHAGEKGWEALYKDHVADFNGLFGRMSFNLDGSNSTVPTDQLVKNYNNRSLNATGKEAQVLYLEQLYFSYGRYLMISASRGVDVPTNLQGIWNNSGNAPWGADIHSNINVQMNYWPAEPTNLSELHHPFLNYIINMANGENWQFAAKRSGQTKGWTCYTENNIFGGMTTWGDNYCVANAWYCTHLWQHYRYTLDKAFLQRAFPTMWSAAEYWMERMIPDRRVKDGTYVCPDEYSPEQNDHPREDGTAHSQQLVYELLSNVKASLDILGQEACGLTDAQVAELNQYLEKVDRGLHVETFVDNWSWNSWGAQNGIKVGDKLLKEWKYTPYTVSSDKGHRHMSHLMALYPLGQIAPDSEYFTPAVNALKLRGDDATGWSMGWKVNLWARALDGDHAHRILKNALKHSTSYDVDQSRGGIYYNLYDSHAPFQIDGNFGVCSGVAEMLMQSHTGVIQLLPALPAVWQKGVMKGMKAVGDFTVDEAWEKGELTEATIVSNKGQKLQVTYPGLAKAEVLVDGKKVTPTVINENTLEIPAAMNEVVNLYLNGIPTGIDAVEGTEHEVKVIYDLSGRRVSKTDKGIYIVNGQKVMVK